MKVRASIKKFARENVVLISSAILIILFVVIFFWQNIFISIKAGEAGVLYLRFFGGTVVDKVYSEGFHTIAPWDIMTKYNTRFQIKTHDMYVLTKRGMKIEIFLTIRFKPEYQLLGVLHQTVGPNYPDKIVIPEAEAVIRKIVGQFEAEEVYSTKRAIIQKIVNESISEVSQRYIRIDDVIITRVELPDSIRRAIEAKLEQRELAEAYQFKLVREEKEAERKRIEAKGYHDYNKTIDASLSDRILTWRGVQATLELSKSDNSKVVIIGSGKDGLPIILDAKDSGYFPKVQDPSNVKDGEPVTKEDKPEGSQ